MLNVLIADDDVNVCECLLRLLPWEDMYCTPPKIVHDGLSAWNILQNELIDFFICDVKMPIMEGTELASLVYERKIHTAIVFLTAYENFTVARHALRYSVLDYILKPINRESLDTLERIIRHSSQEKLSNEWSKKFFDDVYEKKVLEAIYKNNHTVLNEMFENLQILSGEVIFSVGNKILYILYEYLCSDIENDRSIYNTLYKKWCSEFFLQSNKEDRIEYLRMLYEEQLEKIHSNTEGYYIIASKIKHLIDENFTNVECRVAWIAEKVHISSAYAGRVFSRAYGIGITDYITECRIAESQRLMIDDNISISKIAAQVGYTDANYFTKLFRSKMGVSPSDYRKNILKI